MSETTMKQPGSIQATYYLLTMLNTFAASFIWGVNTLFLLDAGLTNSQAFAANSFFTLGQVIFEIPTGVVADTWGRRASYLVGSATLLVTTLLYMMLWKYKAPFASWAIVSIALGLGFTFFSGAVEAWLVDALSFHGFKGDLETVFARGQIAGGVAMLVGSTLGGFIAQKTDLGVPYIVRCGMLVLSFFAAWFWMKDWGFEPRKLTAPGAELRQIVRRSFDVSLRNRGVRWAILMNPFILGVSFYAFYAAQPLLLELYGDKKAYGAAGLVAALVAGSQIAGGFAVPFLRKFLKNRTVLLTFIVIGSVALLTFAGLTKNFITVLVLLSLWGLLGAALVPVRRVYLNERIPSSERATALSFDGMVGSLGGAIIQPGLGRSADVWGYSTSFVIAGVLQILAWPFVWLMKKEDGREADGN